MRTYCAVLRVFLVAVLAGCSDRRPDVAAPERQLAGVPDLDGTPDLIVDENMLAASWVIYDETFSSTSCTVLEGGFPAGAHRVLRFTVTTPNIGDADIAIGDPNAHIDPNGDGKTNDSDGLYEFAECHNHFHFRNYALYEILPVNADGSLGKSIQAKKRGFCMIDTTPWRETEAPHQFVYDRCGRPGLAGNQGISTGWADQYFKFLSGQFFLITDPKEPIQPGAYLIRITVNPPFTRKGNEPCPAVDPQGFCHMFAESNYANNVGAVSVTVPDRVGKNGFGPGAGPPQAESIDDENRPTEK